VEAGALMAYAGVWGTFVHVPKCAGWGFRRYLEKYMGAGEEIAPFHGVPGDIENGFAIIRHPIDWLRSFWSFRNNDGWVVRYNDDGTLDHVNYWPAIIGMTQWAKGTTWPEFVDALVDHQIDIVSNIYGMYQHHNVKFYKLEEIHVLLLDLGLDYELQKYNVTQNKPIVTKQEQEKLAYVCHRSIRDYGYI
jgi:hypothetical protein